MDKAKYIILGSNNFWYSLCYSKKEAKTMVKEIKKDHNNMCFADPETGYQPMKPEELIIYKVEEIKN